ncbi:MAG: nucleoside triphosphate pyrophosphohydrolase [Mariprofundaceae bacterium]
MPDRINNKDNYFDKLRELMNVLRKECPWDKEQTIESLRQYTLEETHEVLEGIDHALKHDDWNILQNELGDLLLQVAFYACIAEEKNKFTLQDVFEGLISKMIYRHPHVFADASPDSLSEQWESLKDAEHLERKSLMDGIPPLPALSYAKKQQRRAARVGFDWNDADDVITKMYEELSELAEEVKAKAPQQRLEDEFGDVLFTLVNLARKLELDAELCLMQTNRKFGKRFRCMESISQKNEMNLSDLSLDELEKIYLQAKKDIQNKEKS